MPTPKRQTPALLLWRTATLLLVALVAGVVSSCSSPHGSSETPAHGRQQKLYANETLALSFTTDGSDSFETHRYPNKNYTNETISVSFELSDPAAVPK